MSRYAQLVRVGSKSREVIGIVPRPHPHPRKIGRRCAAPVPKPLPYLNFFLWPTSVIFPKLYSYLRLYPPNSLRFIFSLRDSENDLIRLHLVINKSDSHCAVVRLCYQSYDNRPNWTPLSPITITYLPVYRRIDREAYK